MSSGSTATMQLADEFDADDSVLGDQMDALVPQFSESNAKFVEDYNNARIIVDSDGGGGNPHRHRLRRSKSLFGNPPGQGTGPTAEGNFGCFL